MSIVTRLLASALLLQAVPVASAQTSSPLTLDDCIKKALAVPSTVSMARRDRDIATLDVTQSRAGFLPQSAVTSSYTYNSPWNRDRSTQSFVALNGVREFTALFNVFQEIDTSGRLRADYARARASHDAASTSLAIAQRELRRAVAAAYYRALLARHLETAIGASLTESESFEQRTQLLARAGEAARADVVKASAQTAFLRQALNSAQLAARLANQDLAAFWTQDVQQPLNLADVLDQPLPPPEAAGEAAAYTRRLEFRFFDAQQRVFQAESRAAKSNLYPRLSALFQFGVDANSPAWQDRGYVAAASLTFPVFDWFKSISQARQFQAQAAQVSDQRAIAQRTLSAEYQAALDRVRQLHQQIGMSSNQVALSEEDLKLSRIRYEGGEGSALDVVTAQNQVAQARTNYYSAIAAYLTARVDLEVASGR